MYRPVSFVNNSQGFFFAVHIGTVVNTTFESLKQNWRKFSFLFEKEEKIQKASKTENNQKFVLFFVHIHLPTHVTSCPHIINYIQSEMRKAHRRIHNELIFLFFFSFTEPFPHSERKIFVWMNCVTNRMPPWRVDKRGISLTFTVQLKQLL